MSLKITHPFSTALLLSACLAPSFASAVTAPEDQPTCKEPMAPLKAFEERTPAEMGFDQEKLEAAMAANRLGSISQHTMIIRRGCLAARRLQLSTPLRPYEGYSISKSITSMALGIAIERGELSWADPVGSLEPRVDLERGGITLKNLGNATSGLERGFLEDFGYTRAFVEKGWFFGNDLALVNISRPLIHEPGTYWQYSQGNIGLSSSMLKTATGVGAKEYLDTHVMPKLGIPKMGWMWWKDAADTEFGFAGAAMPSSYYARLAQMVMRGGVYNGERVLPKRYLREIKSDKNLNPIYSRMVWNNRGIDGELVAGPWAKNTVEGKLMPGVPEDALFFLGGSSNFIMMVPSLDLVVVHNQSLSYNNPGINVSLMMMNRIIHSIVDGSIDYLGPYKELPNVVQLAPDGSLDVDSGESIRDALFGEANPAPTPEENPRPRALAILGVAVSDGGLAVSVKCPNAGGTGTCAGSVSIADASDTYSLAAGETATITLAESGEDGSDVTVTTTNTTGNRALGEAATTVNRLTVRVGE